MLEAEIKSEKKSLFTEGTMVKADIFTDKDCVIDNEVHGEIISKAKVIITERGHVKGNVTCACLSCNGKLAGNVKVKGKAILGSKAVIDGTLTASSLITDTASQILKGFKLEK